MFAAPWMPSNYSVTEPHPPPASYLKISIHQCHLCISWVSKSSVGNNIKKLPIRKICCVLAHYDIFMALYSLSMYDSHNNGVPRGFISLGEGRLRDRGFRTFTRPGCCEHSTGTWVCLTASQRLLPLLCHATFPQTFPETDDPAPFSSLQAKAHRWRPTNSRPTDCFLAQKVTLIPSRNLVARPVMATVGRSPRGRQPGRCPSPQACAHLS